MATWGKGAVGASGAGSCLQAGRVLFLFSKQGQWGGVIKRWGWGGGKRGLGGGGMGAWEGKACSHKNAGGGVTEGPNVVAGYKGGRQGPCTGSTAIQKGHGGKW